MVPTGIQLVVGEKLEVPTGTLFTEELRKRYRLVPL